MTRSRRPAPSIDRPLLLAPDNFTPPTRTPWGGTRILSKYKRDVALASAGRHPIVGESWELSVEPDFPSLLENRQTTLAEVLASRGSTALLVKLLDAAQDLSLQIHPDDGYEGLAPGESGKPESWYVLDADAGTGLYLGFRRGVGREDVERALAAGEGVGELLFFTEVAPGDAFVIDAGTPHAVGAGLTLVEPQRVAPGKRGVTYRYWDWGRRYDAAGRVDPTGSARALHAAHALAVTTWDAPREHDLLERIRFRAGSPDTIGPARLEPLVGPGHAAPAGGAPLASASLEVTRLSGDGALSLPESEAVRGLTVVAGNVALEGDGWIVTVETGRTAAIPGGLGTVRARLTRTHALVACAP